MTVSNRGNESQRPVSQIIAAIENFKPLDGKWSSLEPLIQELLRNDSASEGIAALLGVFERYPDEDGAGVFWSIVRGLESLPGYEHRLIESVRRAPSRFSLLMIDRLVDAGRPEVTGTSLLALLEQVAQDPATESGIRRWAKTFLAAHEG